MLPQYKHIQKPGVPFLLTFILALTAIPLSFSGARFSDNSIPLLAGLLVVWALLMMSSLTVTINDTHIRIRFGPGAFFKNFRLSDIVSCDSKYKTFCLGWGIRHYWGGWLYNIAGFKSVEIIFKNGRKARIGTDEPEKLAEAIRNAIGETAKTGI